MQSLSMIAGELLDDIERAKDVRVIPDSEIT